MKKYLFVLHQEGGCDYTIECGTSTLEVEAQNIAEAYMILNAAYGLEANMNYRGEEIEIDAYEISNHISKEELKKETEEFNEYLKLKNKFEEEQ